MRAPVDRPELGTRARATRLRFGLQRGGLGVSMNQSAGYQRNNWISLLSFVVSLKNHLKEPFP